MTAINYHALQTMWQKQEDQYREWRRGMITAMQDLKSDLANKLQLPEALTWKNPNNGEMYPYLTFVDFYGKEKDKIASCKPSERHINDIGELILGISLTLESENDELPKENIFAPVCVRYKFGKIEYAFFKIDLGEPDKHWTSDLGEFSDSLISRWADRVSHDPHQGFDTKQMIGFIID